MFGYIIGSFCRLEIWLSGSVLAYYRPHMQPSIRNNCGIKSCSVINSSINELVVQDVEANWERGANFNDEKLLYL